MNFSRNISILKTIDATLDDKIYLGVTESKAQLDSIDENLVQIDSVLDAIKLDTDANTTHLSNIASSNSNVESELDDVNSTLADIGVTLAKNDKFSLDHKYQALKDSGNSRTIDSGDYSSTSAKIYWQNDEGDKVLVNKIAFTFQSSETTWDKLFTSTSSGSSSFLKIGVGDDGTAIDTSKGFFANNYELQPFMSMVFGDPAGGDNMYYSYVIDGLNIVLEDNEYFICELSGDYSATGDVSFSAGIFYEKSA